MTTEEDRQKMMLVSNQIQLIREIITPAYEIGNEHINRDINNSNYRDWEVEAVRIEGNLIMHYNRLGFSRMVKLHKEKLGMLSASSRGRNGFEREMQVSTFTHQSFKERKQTRGILGIFKKETD